MTLEELHPQVSDHLISGEFCLATKLMVSSRNLYLQLDLESSMIMSQHNIEILKNFMYWGYEVSSESYGKTLVADPDFDVRGALPKQILGFSR